MEESEKRRERLKAMRMEAAQSGSNVDSESPGVSIHGLSNPLIESETASISLQYASPRFDYYTDPMAAFSGSKRRNNTTPQVSQGHYNTPQRPIYPGMAPNPAYQNSATNPPGPRMPQMQGAHYFHSPIRSPIEQTSSSGRAPLNPPSSWGGPRGPYNYSSPPSYSRGNMNPALGHYNYGRGRGQRYNSNPHYDSGRGGRGQSLGNGRGGARSHGSVSAEQRPHLYYSKEMVEDPWESLKPVVWKGASAIDSKNSWLPKSIGMKKAKHSPEASPKISISQPSLAEYLAASFSVPIDEAADSEQG